MELVVQLMLILALFGSFFQMSQWGLIPTLVMALSLGVLCYLVYPWILEQSKQELSQWLNDPQLMKKLATIQMVEVLFFVLVDLAFTRSLFGQKIQKEIRYAGYYPGLIPIAALLFVQMNSFYHLSHLLSFEVIGMLFSGCLMLVFLVFPRILRGLLPEAYLRLEMRYVLSFGQLLCCVALTVFCQKLPYTLSPSSFEVKPFLTLCVLAVGMF
ncbi:hypothetical protein GCM10009119_21500 [Algoriphagus jejuensis]|uniref:Uncharacterized protein n=1 Tax=Algoriphagus jejuensis TaxID=419934 RepID=A0ABN1N0C7_9BACT